MFIGFKIIGSEQESCDKCWDLMCKLTGLVWGERLNDEMKNINDLEIKLM